MPSNDSISPIDLAREVLNTSKQLHQYEQNIREFRAIRRTSDSSSRTAVSAPTVAVAHELSYDKMLSRCRLQTAPILAKFQHTYRDQITGCAAVLSRKKASRLAQEMTDGLNSLPCSDSNAMFVKVDKDRCDIIKILITGVTNTPYASGCFEFDVFCPAEYPDVAPKFSLCTTGNGSIRFNPNLYSNGKVCLSLLGTWSGKGGETWSTSSTLLQVYASIQSLIMTEDVVGTAR